MFTGGKLSTVMKSTVLKSIYKINEIPLKSLGLFLETHSRPLTEALLEEHKTGGHLRLLLLASPAVTALLRLLRGV